MSNVLREILNSGIVTLLADYRGGTARDFSPLQRHGTVTAPVRFSPAGAHFSGVGRITHPDHASGRNTTGSIVILAEFKTQNNNDCRLFSADNAGGTRIEVSSEGLGASRIFVQGGNTLITSSWANRKCLAVDYTPGIKHRLYLDGSFFIDFPAALVVTADDAPINIGNRYTTTSTVHFPIAAVVETNRVLTASEHSALYGELSRTPWPGVPQRSLWAGCSLLDGRDPTLLASYDLVNSTGVCFDKTGVANGTVTGTASDLGPGGMPALQFNGVSDKIITTTSYVAGARTFSWWSKSTCIVPYNVFDHGDYKAYFGLNWSASRPLLIFDAAGAGACYRIWSDVPQQDDGQWHHWVLTMNAGVEDSALYCDGVAQTISSTGVTPGFGVAWTALRIGSSYGASTRMNGSLADFRVYNYAMTPAQVVEFRRKNYAQLNTAVTDWGAPVSDAARGGVAGQYLENTGWQFGTATPRYVVDVAAIEGRTVKTIKCVTAGHLYQSTALLGQTPQEAAYGTWEFSFNKAAASIFQLMLVSSDTSAPGTTSNGYLFYIYGNEQIKVFRVTGAGFPNTPIDTVVPFIADSYWYQFRITRSAAGLWNMWVRGGVGSAFSYPNWVLVAGTVDNVHTISNYQILDNDAGDLISLGDVCGNLGFTKAQL